LTSKLFRTGKYRIEVQLTAGFADSP